MSRYGFLTESWLPFVTMSLFALSNGYVTSSAFTLGPLSVKNKFKEPVGFLLSFGLIFGISSGSFLALAF